MYSFVYSGALIGIESMLVKVEADVSPGLPCFEMVGMLNTEVKEAKERVRVSMKNNGIVMPPQRVTVNISPGNIRKSGTQFDLPIAISILKCTGRIPAGSTDEALFIGELGLNGELLFINGVLPIILEAKKNGIRQCIVPSANKEEAAVVEGVDIYGFDHISQVLDFLQMEDFAGKGQWFPVKPKYKELFTSKEIKGPDFSEVAGQTGMKRAAEIAAAGFHHLMMIGPPGSGKTMIAKRIPYILPPLSMEESLEVSKIYSVSGKLNSKQFLITQRPFLSPHHTISEQAMSGGGRIPKPGALSLAHRGILFLDEAVHFSGAALETLRQPLEDKKIEIARSYGTYSYPADFMLVAAINPCPCGYFPDRNRCNCTPWEIKRYLSKISGPILDRIDLCTEAPKLGMKDLEIHTGGEGSAQIRERVMKAREIQKARFRDGEILFNSQMGTGEIEKYCKLGRKEYIFAEKIFNNLGLSARSYHKLLRVARTIADLEGKEAIDVKHLAEAAGYRTNGKLEEV